MKIIFDTDAASDDVMAFVYLAAHSSIKIAGVTVTGTGAAHAKAGASNMANLCSLLGQPDIPIAYGSETPIDAHGKPFPDWMRNKKDHIFDGMDVPEHPNPNISNSAIQLIKKTLENSKEKMSIMALGPLSNIAELVRTYPHLSKKIERIVIMGGAVSVPGNINELDSTSNNNAAEWNIYADPKAAEIVFASRIPITLVPLDVCNQVKMTKDFYNKLGRENDTGLNLSFKLLKDLKDMVGDEAFFKEFGFWDQLAAMLLVHPEIAVTEIMRIQVDLETAKTAHVSENTGNAAFIQVATHIVADPEEVLNRFINDINHNRLVARLMNSELNLFKLSDHRIDHTAPPLANGFRHS